MQINRAFLYSGVFLLAIGIVLLTADWAIVDTSGLTTVLRLWPLAFVAIGIGLVLRRTQFALAAGIAAAAIPALLIGSALAAAPRLTMGCGEMVSPGQPIMNTSSGAFDAPATVSLRAGCGNLTVTTMPGNAWQLTLGNATDQPAAVSATDRSLIVGEERKAGWHFFDGGGRDTWNLALPTSAITELSVDAQGNQGQLALAGAQVGRLVLDASASEMTVDASQASVAALSAVAQFASLSIHLPAGDITAELRAGGSDIQLCTQPGVGLSLARRGTFDQVTVAGDRLRESEWQSADYVTAALRIDLSIQANFSSIEINPEGGCR